MGRKLQFEPPDEFELAESMLLNFPERKDRVLRLIFPQDEKWTGFLLAYQAGDYLVQHEAGIGPKSGKAEGLVILKAGQAPILADRIVCALYMTDLRHFSSAMLLDPYKIRDDITFNSMSGEAVLLKDMKRARKAAQTDPALLALRMAGKTWTQSVPACSGGLPTLGKRR